MNDKQLDRMSRIALAAVKVALSDRAGDAMKANNWTYAYALGYEDGKADARAGRKPEISSAEKDEYAQGYHKGYHDHARR